MSSTPKATIKLCGLVSTGSQISMLTPASANRRLMLASHDGHFADRDAQIVKGRAGSPLVAGNDAKGQP
jgi:hypothetical protein